MYLFHLSRRVPGGFSFLTGRVLLSGIVVNLGPPPVCPPTPNLLPTHHYPRHKRILMEKENLKCLTSEKQYFRVLLKGSPR